MIERLLSSFHRSFVRLSPEHTVSQSAQVMSKVRVALCRAILVLTVTSCVQAASTEQSVQLTEHDARFRVVTVSGERLLLHLKNGHERIVAFPEAIELSPERPTLPDCDIVLDKEVVAFYPTRTFERVSLKFIGVNSGTVYELGIRSSGDGMLQPLKLVR